MHRGPVGTIALNARLQSALNPSGPALESRGQTLRAGDKVMQRRNDYERDVFNGDIGAIGSVDSDGRELVVRFDQRDVHYEDADLDALTLAYATSIHKSQGSEYPAVVIPLLTEPLRDAEPQPALHRGHAREKAVRPVRRSARAEDRARRNAA